MTNKQNLDIKEIMTLFSGLNIDFFRLKSEDFELEMKKENSIPQERTQPLATGNIPSPIPEIHEAPAEIEKLEKEMHTIISPIPGTFYRAPAPGESPFVEIGDKVKIGDVLCLIEAMKVMNKIESDITGEVVEILTEDAKTVEYGTALLKIKPF